MIDLKSAVSAALFSILFAAMLIGVSSLGKDAQRNGTFSLPGSALLFADQGNELQIVTPTGTEHMKLPVNLPVNSGIFTLPGLGHDARSVSWGFATAVDLNAEIRPRDRPHFALGMRSVTESKWKTFGDFHGIGGTAISPDGSKIAFTVELEHARSLMILEVSAGKVTTVALTSPIVLNGGVSWSPDGKQLVVERFRRDQPSLISIVDLSTSGLRDLSEGYSPSWSSTGEWIAYLDYQREMCSLVRPDGTGVKLLRDIRKKDRMIYGSAVWSPDGKQLLLNEWNEWKGYGFNIQLLDIATGESRRIVKDGKLPVFGWAELAQHN